MLPDKVVLDEAMIEAHFAWVQQSVSWETAKSYRLYLAQWANYLRGRDLRGLRAVQDLKPHLDGAPCPTASRPSRASTRGS